MNDAQQDMSRTLFPEWKPVLPPQWFIQQGLMKSTVLLGRWRRMNGTIKQAEADGIDHVVPMLLAFNATVPEARAMVGRKVWREIHRSTLNQNAHRAGAMYNLKFSLSEAMQIPAKHSRHFVTLARNYTFPAALFSLKSDKLKQRETISIVARDFIRMGGVLNPEWSVSRLKREHDAKAIEGLLEKADSTPFLKSWFGDFDGYSFSLLCSEADFAIEGITQRHCVKSYARSSKRGDIVVFRVMGPERATASFGTRQRYSMDSQIKGFANSEVSDDCHAAAHKAITEYMRSLK